jgi:hypothetical protein
MNAPLISEEHPESDQHGDPPGSTPREERDDRDDRDDREKDRVECPVRHDVLRMRVRNPYRFIAR